MPDYTRRSESLSEEQDENKQTPHSTTNSLAQQDSNQTEDPPHADMLTNRESYLENRPSYLGYTVSNPPQPSTPNSALTDADLDFNHRLDRIIINSMKQRSIAATFSPDRSRSAPANSNADRNSSAAQRQEERPMSPPELVQADGEGYSSPTFVDGALSAGTPSEVGRSVYSSSGGEESQEAVESGFQQGSGGGADRPGSRSGLIEGKEADVEMREVDEEELERGDEE